jgi:hypothetical protein
VLVTVIVLATTEPVLSPPPIVMAWPVSVEAVNSRTVATVSKRGNPNVFTMFHRGGAAEKEKEA